MGFELKNHALLLTKRFLGKITQHLIHFLQQGGGGGRGEGHIVPLVNSLVKKKSHKNFQ